MARPPKAISIVLPQAFVDRVLAQKPAWLQSLSDASFLEAYVCQGDFSVYEKKLRAERDLFTEACKRLGLSSKVLDKKKDSVEQVNPETPAVKAQAA